MTEETDVTHFVHRFVDKVCYVLQLAAAEAGPQPPEASVAKTTPAPAAFACARRLPFSGFT
jgi:hypothetical protein